MRLALLGIGKCAFLDTGREDHPGRVVGADRTPVGDQFLGRTRRPGMRFPGYRGTASRGEPA